MTEPTDEMLMAYADGQLSDDDRKSVELYLSANPASRDRLQVFIETGPALARALEAATAGPVPARLVATVLGGRPLSPARQNQASLRERVVAALRLDGRMLFPLAAVACASLAVGFGIGRLTDRGELAPAAANPLYVTSLQGALSAGPALHRVLETASSGTASALDDRSGGLLATPVLSFKTRGEGVCRQYRVNASDAAGAFDGLACRQPDGSWRIDTHAAAETRQQSNGRMAPASGSRTSAIDAVVERLIDGDPFGAVDEARLLQDGWKIKNE